MPLSVAEVLAARHAGPSACAEFEEAICAYHGSQAAFAVSSARAALWLALRALKARHPDRTRVLLPAYTCPTVGRAVVAAGLEGLCLDVSARDFNLDAAEVEAHLSERVLAVIAAHMFGTPCDLARLLTACRQAGAVLLEDAAQACGARFAGQTVGSFGEMGVLSLGRSKNLRGAGGGVLLVNEPSLVGPVAALVGELSAAARPASSILTKQLAVSVLSAPHAWNLARRLPFLHVGAEDSSFDPEPFRLAPWQAALGTLALSRLEEYNARRAALGRTVERELAAVHGVHIQAKAPPQESAYVRLALRLDCGREERDAVEGSLLCRGIDARAFYTRPMPEYDWWPRSADQPPCPEAQRLIASNLALPLHYEMIEADAARVSAHLADRLPS
jgi:dTDP-4-amino-4,6-dideoxygalactose transaminase